MSKPYVSVENSLVTMRIGPAASRSFLPITCSIHLSWLVIATAISSRRSTKRRRAAGRDVAESRCS